MKIEDLRKIVNNIQYKPNVKFTVRESMELTHWVITTHLAVSAPSQMDEAYIKYFQDNTINYIDGNFFIAKIECDLLSEELIVEKIFGSIRDTEIHEMKEWFLYKNIKIYNPHKEEHENKANRCLAFDTNVGI